MRSSAALAIMAAIALSPGGPARAQNQPPSGHAAIQVPARLKPAMEAAFKEGRSYFIWFVKDTDRYKAESAGMPFPHALIECYGVANPRQVSQVFQSTIEMAVRSWMWDPSTTRSTAPTR